MADPRNYQIVVLTTFVLVGYFWLEFNFEFSTALIIITAAVVSQRLVFKDAQYRSALISALSLVLLLRTDEAVIAGLAAVLAISSKKLIRIGGQHVFNPSAFALVTVTTVFSHAWLAPGQWGALGFSVLLIAGAGLLVVTRAQRLDVALSFFVCFAAIVVLRGLWLGDPLVIAMHQLQNGALVVFSFFMITDPRTTPVTPKSRIFYGAGVAVLAAVFQFVFYISSAPLFALVLTAPLVAIFNLFLLDKTYEKNILRFLFSDRVFVDWRCHSILRFLRRQG